MARPSRYSPAVRERAVRMVLENEREYDSQWSAIVSIASMIGSTPETFRKWVRQTVVDTERRGGMTTDERARIKELERENRELWPAAEAMTSYVDDHRETYGVEPIYAVLPIVPST